MISEQPRRSRPDNWRGFMRRAEMRLPLILLIVAGAIWAAVGLAGEVREGETQAIDRQVLLAFRLAGDVNTPIGPRWLQETERDLTALGGFTVLSLISVFAVILLLMHRRRVQAAIFAAAVVTAQILSALLKQAIGRPRPELVAHLDLTYSNSFPSGHATMAPVVYLTLAVLLATGTERQGVRAMLVGGAMLLVAAIGVSRVYLGVHWPSDVLGGWALGSAIAILASWAVYHAAPTRGPGGTIRPDGEA